MATTIPLSCNICPKKPKFSDVSHLLTHVASKGHLSNYYKVKVRAGGDPAARNAMDEYDRWYSEWRVEDLMSDRMNLKDKKKPRTRATASTRGSSAVNGNRTRTAASRLNANTRPVPQRTPSLNAFDPRLVGPAVKSEPTPTPPLHSSAIPSMMQPMQRLAHATNGSPYLTVRGDPMSFGYNPALGAAAGRRDSLFEMTESTESPGSYTYPEPPVQSRFTGLPAAAVSSPTLQTHSTPSRPSTPDQRDQDHTKLKR
ncbi:hypothetical protein BLS_003262, partial [Venturia inaequalis]